jgi:hypothetical protein
VLDELVSTSLVAVISTLFQVFPLLSETEVTALVVDESSEMVMTINWPAAVVPRDPVVAVPLVLFEVAPWTNAMAINNNGGQAVKPTAAFPEYWDED